MDEAEGNPAENQLRAGVTDAVLSAAVEMSGYPLQTLVAARLRDRGYGIAEEWVFEDADTNQLRALDLHASKRLYDWEREENPRVRPEVALLIECKRSELPYVFFASSTRPGYGGRALPVSGLHRDRVQVFTDDDPSTWNFSALQALDLDDHAFVCDPPQVALAFSKAVRKNKDLILSGADPYQSLVLPMAKALASYPARVAPPKTAVYHDLILPIGVAVFDAPLVVASVDEATVSYELVPWVRVYRHDVDPAAGHKFDRERLHSIDCVHEAWLSEYLDRHLEPFTAEFATRALRHDVELASGTGFVSGLGRRRRREIEPHLRPRDAADVSRRPVTYARALSSLVRRRAVDS